jgi:demethylmenaquinone methyltransferase/2-methoxy-6-polyprenyl-1,4-benzoquinol methylase
MRQYRAKYYDWFSHFYDRFVALHSHDRQGTLRKELASATGLRPGEMVLDLCTGTGAQLPELLTRVAADGRVVGVDFSRGMLARAQSKPWNQPAVCLVQADVAALPFEPSVFDAVTCSHAFYELSGEASARSLREVKRVLKPGKPFLMAEHDIPAGRITRILFYIRIYSMGRRRSIEILQDEEGFFRKYFGRVKKITPPGGRSKILICTTAPRSEAAKAPSTGNST